MSKEYFNDFSDRWDEVASEMDSARLELLVQRFGLAPGMRVLDVGTGTGVLLPFLASKRCSVVALDYAESMLRRARDKDFKGDIDYVMADVQSLPLADGVFDAVVCYSSFPHFRDKTRALEELRRVIRKGGRLFICHTSSREEINRRHGQVPVLVHDLVPEQDEMEQLLSDAGFTDIDVEETADSYFSRARKP